MINLEKKKMENFSIRINSEIMKIIKEKSTSENASVNYTINQLLDNAIRWDIYAPCAGWIPMPKQILIELIDKCSYEEIVMLAQKLGKQIAHDILLFTQGKYDVNSWLHFLKIRSAISGFQFIEQRENNVIKCILNHGLGGKWTIWFKSFYEIVLKDMKTEVSFDVSENIFTMNIKQ